MQYKKLCNSKLVIGTYKSVKPKEKQKIKFINQ